MCGILGIVSDRKLVEQNLPNMVEVLRHRGPDDSGIKIINTNNETIGLGHTRLSIMDLTINGRQPMEHKSLTIVFNGEIYNHKEIKKDLECAGYDFNTGTDTEVIIKAIDCYGYKESIKRFIGMFSIAIYDSDLKEITLIRDRLGVKPLFYSVNSDSFVFASEIKSILESEQISKEANENYIQEFLIYGYCFGENTPFKEINEVPAGSIVKFNLNQPGCVSIKKYYDLASLDDDIDIKSDINDLVERSIRYRMVSDAEVGCFVSGGVDSGIVAALASKISNKRLKTFSISFEDKNYDEGDRAELLSLLLGTDHYKILFNEDALNSIIPEMQQVNDELINDWSMLPMLVLSREARKKVKVVLSGDGGDEFFFGYKKYSYALSMLSKPYFYRSFISIIFRMFAYFLSIIKTSRAIKYKNYALYKSELLFSKDEFEALRNMSKLIDRKNQNEIFNHELELKNNYKVGTAIPKEKRIRIYDIVSYLTNNILRKVDRSTMLYGLEARDPLLDSSLYEYGINADINQLTSKGKGKAPLRNLLSNLLPKYPEEKIKKGFSVPMEKWMRTTLRDEITNKIKKNILETDNILNANSVSQLLENFMDYGEGNAKFIWGIYLYASWKEKWKQS